MFTIGSKMKKPVKAALLSAFVYPGVGHFFIKKYVICAIFSCTFSLALYFIIIELIIKAQDIAAQIANGEIPLNIAAISEAVTSSAAGVDAQEIDIKMYVLVVIWIIAIIDAYRLGRDKS
jgi:hypothetical protein